MFVDYGEEAISLARGIVCGELVGDERGSFETIDRIIDDPRERKTSLLRTPSIANISPLLPLHSNTMAKRTPPRNNSSNPSSPALTLTFPQSSKSTKKRVMTR